MSEQSSQSGLALDLDDLGAQTGLGSTAGEGGGDRRLAHATLASNDGHARATEELGRIHKQPFGGQAVRRIASRLRMVVILAFGGSVALGVISPALAGALT